MSITIEIAPELQAELARQAATLGVEIDAYAADLLKRAVHLPAEPGKSDFLPSTELVEAVGRLRNFGKTHGLSLGGMTIRELRHEARP